MATPGKARLIMNKEGLFRLKSLASLAKIDQLEFEMHLPKGAIIRRGGEDRVTLGSALKALERMNTPKAQNLRARMVKKYKAGHQSKVKVKTKVRAVERVSKFVKKTTTEQTLIDTVVELYKQGMNKADIGKAVEALRKVGKL